MFLGEKRCFTLQNCCVISPNASQQFYQHLGFSVLAGCLEMNYLILKNENALIGLFQGMFQGNILTFNPGWTRAARTSPSLTTSRTSSAT